MGKKSGSVFLGTLAALLVVGGAAAAVQVSGLGKMAVDQINEWRGITPEPVVDVRKAAKEGMIYDINGTTITSFVYGFEEYKIQEGTYYISASFGYGNIVWPKNDIRITSSNGGSAGLAWAYAPENIVVPDNVFGGLSFTLKASETTDNQIETIKLGKNSFLSTQSSGATWASYPNLKVIDLYAQRTTDQIKSYVDKAPNFEALVIRSETLINLGAAFTTGIDIYVPDELVDEYEAVATLANCNILSIDDYNFEEVIEEIPTSETSSVVSSTSTSA